MSQTVIFSIGAVVFGITIWGVVMAGGAWFGQFALSDDAQSAQRLVIEERDPDDRRSAPDER